MNDYERIAQVIQLIDRERLVQPDLATLAAAAGLSPHHFHRLFSRWAGVTPKEFLRCLTLEHAKSLLRGGASVLDASLDSGLSGPGRLHDLCVHLESATPGEWRTGGSLWTIRFGFAESPFGRVLIGDGPRGVCHLDFCGEDEAGAVLSLSKAWPAAELERDDVRALEIASQVFCIPGPDQPPGKDRVIRAFVRGTAMQVKVWRALLRIPSGALTSYGSLALEIGLPRAARAVGSAVGSNPLAYLIPCHRVIRGTGALGGYRWDVRRKKIMIARESIEEFKARPGGHGEGFDFFDIQQP